MRQVQDEIATKTAIFPTVLSGTAAVYGPAFNRRGFSSAIMSCQLGTTSGTPTRLSAAFKVQECDTETGSFSDITSASITFSGTSAQISRNYSGEIPLDLRGAKVWIRGAVTPAWTGGTTPTVEASATFVLGEAAVQPV